MKLVRKFLSKITDSTHHPKILFFLRKEFLSPFVSVGEAMEFQAVHLSHLKSTKLPISMLNGPFVSTTATAAARGSPGKRPLRT